MNTFLLFAAVVVANSAIFFIGFVARYALRNRAKDVKESSADHDSSSEVKEEQGFAFRFQYQITDRRERNCQVEEAGEEKESSSIQKCSFLPEKDLSGFIQQTEVRILRVEEPKESAIEEFDSSSSSDRDCERPGAEICGWAENDDDGLLSDEGLEKEKGMNSEAHITSEEFSGFDSEADSISLSDGYSVRDLVVDSDGFLSEKDGEDEKNSPIESACSNSKILFLGVKASEREHVNLHREEADSSPVHKSGETDVEFTDSSDDDDAYLEELPNAGQMDAKMSKRDSEEQLHAAEAARKYPDWGMPRPEKTKPKDSGEEDYDELESLWEHQDLIEQLRMELRKMKDIGLPTILEESESPQSVEDLKPLKMDESFLHEDPMDELQRSYRSYRERMRNFDMLNYQKMYAIGFLQLDDPLRSKNAHSRLLPQGFRSVLRRSKGDHPLEKLISELQSDLETVYVGQMCLSWEFLRWQYEKVREMPESDSFRSHCYNQVAGEFQQFQVVMQRFIENESFQGPRLPNYIRNRCVLRSLLQVPVIREDCSKGKMEGEERGMTIEVLEDIMEESIRVFWEFVRADRDEAPGILKGFIMGPHVELQDPADGELMEEIKSDLHKKEKRLKDMQRSGNCLVKKLKRPKEDRPNQDLFSSQVDLKLVARVLRMSRITTEHLLWCHEKLDKIKLVERKLSREPSFLLFPC